MGCRRRATSDGGRTHCTPPAAPPPPPHPLHLPGVKAAPLNTPKTPRSRVQIRRSDSKSWKTRPKAIETLYQGLKWKKIFCVGSFFGRDKVGTPKYWCFVHSQ